MILAATFSTPRPTLATAGCVFRGHDWRIRGVSTVECRRCWRQREIPATDLTTILRDDHYDKE